MIRELPTIDNDDDELVEVLFMISEEDLAHSREVMEKTGMTARDFYGMVWVRWAQEVEREGVSAEGDSGEGDFQQGEDP